MPVRFPLIPLQGKQSPRTAHEERYIVEFWFLTANSLNVHSLFYYNYSYCKFIDILFKRLNFSLIEFSLYIGFIVLENRS